MAWSEQEISTYQIHNNKMLEEINETLPGLTGKPIVGIFCPGQHGDTMVCTSALRYKNEFWPDKDIVWLCNQPVCDVLKYSKEVNQVRPWPWAGNGLPENTPDFWPLLMNENNQLNLELASQYELTKDLSSGYFPCPYMLEPRQRHNIEYSNCSKKIFGIPDDYEWHPVLNFSDEEVHNAGLFMKQISKRKCVLFETFAGSSQSIMSDELVKAAIKLCRVAWPDCNFIFASHKYLRLQEQFPDGWFEQEGFYSSAIFTVRQCALVAEQCDLMISVSSGITVAASAWGVKQPTTIQFCGSKICSTAAISNGRFELVTADNKSIGQSNIEFLTTLEKLLNE